MTAYSFKRQFVEPILAGTKGGTIRANRRRHARPGEELQLYTGMRTKHCKLIARKTCLAVEPIELDFVRMRIHVGPLVLEHRVELSTFARFDGFPDFASMAAFWIWTHETFHFAGWHIRWFPLPVRSGDNS